MNIPANVREELVVNILDFVQQTTHGVFYRDNVRDITALTEDFITVGRLVSYVNDLAVGLVLHSNGRKTYKTRQAIWRQVPIFRHIFNLTSETDVQKVFSLYNRNVATGEYLFTYNGLPLDVCTTDNIEQCLLNENVEGLTDILNGLRNGQVSVKVIDLTDVEEIKKWLNSTALCIYTYNGHYLRYHNGVLIEHMLRTGKGEIIDYHKSLIDDFDAGKIE